MKIMDLGLIDYPRVFELQERLVTEIAASREPETLLLLEYQPVYTIGSGGNEANVLDPSVAAIRCNRGGDVTWHGPGQLVGYPLLDLNRRGRDLHCHLRLLEEMIIRTAATFGVSASRVTGRTGVWTDRGKLAAIGVGVRRWVTMHGFSLNVCNDLAPFSLINPCGIPACPVTSLSLERSVSVGVSEVKEAMVAAFQSRDGA